jgi:predicted acylesterase/phospholipase RssA
LIKIIVKKKLGNENATFKDLHEKYPKPQLIITGTNLNTVSQDIYSYEHTPDMKLWEAIRISTCVPLYFHSFFKEGNVLVDGGISNNYPINYFKNERECTLGFALKVSGFSVIDTFDRFVIALLHCMNSLQSFLEKEYESNTIILQINKSIVDFDFSDSYKKEIIETGYNQFSQQFYEKHAGKFLPDMNTNTIINHSNLNSETEIKMLDDVSNDKEIKIDNLENKDMMVTNNMTHYNNIQGNTKDNNTPDCQFTMDLISDIQSIISRHSNSNSPDYLENIEAVIE